MRLIFMPLVVGVGLGAVDSAVNHVAVVRGEVGLARGDRSGWTQAAEFVSFVLDSGWGWAAVAVLVGWLVARRGRGVAAAAAGGLVALAAATAVYYAVDVLFDGGDFWGPAVEFWLIRAVLLGPVLGAVGALTRRPGPVGMIAGLVVPVGAVAGMALFPPQQDSPMARPVVGTVWLAAALMTVVVLVRSRKDRSAS